MTMVAVFVSSETLQMIILDNRCDRAYEASVRICANLKIFLSKTAILNNPELDTKS